jgi:hypothetical protein
VLLEARGESIIPEPKEPQRNRNVVMVKKPTKAVSPSLLLSGRKKMKLTIH